jgi:lipopolysaccharide transport system permease protein
MAENWTTILKPKKRWFDFNFAEIWAYRDLIMLFVRRDFVSIYKQTILGPIWFFIQPIFTTIVFTVIFGKIARIPTPGIPTYLFYLSGIINWNYFADCLTKTSNTFKANSGIFGKVYFPRLVVPISIVITNLITYLIQFSLFLFFLVSYYMNNTASFNISASMLIFPLLILQMALLGLGLGIIVSSMTTKYKDLVFAVTFGVQLWMYATPIVYPMSQVPEKWKMLFYANPMTPVVEIFRNAFFNLNQINWGNYIYSWVLTLAILFIGILFFNRVEKSFMDTV